MSMLGETIKANGSCNIQGKVGYVAQQAWIFQGTLRFEISLKFLIR